jgi:hypothetical protein
VGSEVAAGRLFLSTCSDRRNDYLHHVCWTRIFAVAAKLWDPEGLQRIADIILHDLIPVMYVGYWLFLASKVALRWRSVMAWLIYPLAYLFLIMIRGALSGRYPYPFVDAGQLGYPRVFANTGVLLLAFVGVGLLVVAASCWLRPSRAVSSEQPK